MTTAIAFLPLLLLPFLYALFAKASAFLFGRAQISWLHSLIFGALLVFAGFVGALLHRAAGSPLPISLAVLLSFALLVTVGGWYLGPRAKSAIGSPLQFKGGAILSSIVFGLLALFGIVFAVLVPLLLHAHQA